MGQTKNAFLDALYSEKANTENKEGLNLFGQFVGEWDVEWFGYEPNKEEQYEKGEWIFSWALEGRIIQDLWIIPGRDRRNQSGLPSGEYGTTLRHYNKETKKWNIVWLGPIKNRFNIFEAKQIGDEIVLDEISNKTEHMKWIFSEIKANYFRWRSILSSDGGENWTLVQEMKVTRKSKNKLSY